MSLRRFITTNQLLGSYRWTVGGKTGYTSKAGRCLVASASRGGRRLVAVALGSPNAFADVRALFEYGFSKFVRARLANRGQPVSPAPGRPPDYQAGADTDALVRLDQLGRVRLTLPEAANGTPGTGTEAGGTGTEPGGGAAGTAGAATTGTAAGDPRGGGTAWFTVGGRRLVALRLVRLASGGAVPSSSMPQTAPTGPAGGSATTLTVGAAVPLRPVPPGAAAPVIEPFFRRSAA